MKFRMAAHLMDDEVWRRQPADRIHEQLAYFDIEERERRARG